MPKRYIKLDKAIKDYSADELRGILGGRDNSVIIRSIILNEKEFSRIDYDRSLRSLWYATVKPALDKLGLLTETTEDTLTHWDGELSRYTAELVRLGVVTYKDLHILDTSRQRATPADEYDIVSLQTYGYQVTSAPYPNIIISTEKDTVYGIIEGIASFFGCSCISGKGQNSLAAMEDMLRRIHESGNRRLIHILTMTDYDPAGYYIAETFKTQAEDLLRSMGMDNAVMIQRIGITPDQLSHEEVRQNWYTPKKANLDAWMQATGGIDGHEKGLELDALEPGRIRKIFVDSLWGYIEPLKYHAFVKRSYLQRVILEAMQPKVDQIVDDLASDEIDSVLLRGVDLRNLAIQGHTTMPTSQLCWSPRLEEIQERVLTYFA